MYKTKITINSLAEFDNLLNSRPCNASIIIQKAVNKKTSEGLKDSEQIENAVVIPIDNGAVMLEVLLDFNNQYDINDSAAIRLANMLSSGMAPENLQIDLINTNIELYGWIAIAEAIQSGHAPQGLKIYCGFSDYSYQGALPYKGRMNKDILEILGEAIKHPNAPLGLIIKSISSDRLYDLCIRVTAAKQAKLASAAATASTAATASAPVSAATTEYASTPDTNYDVITPTYLLLSSDDEHKEETTGLLTKANISAQDPRPEKLKKSSQL